MRSHWNENVVILTKFSSLAALEVVILTTFSAASDENFIKMKTFPFQCSLYGFIPRSDLCLNQSWIFWNWTARMLGSVKMKTSIKGQINFLKNMFFWLSSMILSYDMSWDCFKNTYELLNVSALKSPLNESHIFQCISQDVCCVWNISHAKYFTQTLKDVNSYNFEILRAHTHFWNASEVPMC